MSTKGELTSFAGYSGWAIIFVVLASVYFSATIGKYLYGVEQRTAIVDLDRLDADYETD